RSAAGSIGVPHSASTRTTSAPQRAATSVMRSPNTPLTPTTTTSPGRTTFTNAASMPAEPVPEIGNVSGLLVRNTWRRRSHVSSSSATNSGSRCPSIGRIRASCTSGYGLQGPGPMRMRSLRGTAGDATYLPIGKRTRAASAGDRAQDAVEDVGFGHEDLVHVEVAEDPDEDAAPADDHVGALRLEPRVVTASGERLGGERAEHVLGGGARQTEVVHGVVVVEA